jgi:hypothetical protein
MSDAASSTRDFYDFFRREFAFLETDASDSSGHGLMSSYFEATFSPGYPWMHQCGFANVFLKFTLDWDPRDQLFMFNTLPRHGRARANSSCRRFGLASASRPSPGERR